jgi:hypothetical protein
VCCGKAFCPILTGIPTLFGEEDNSEVIITGAKLINGRSRV